MKTSSDEMIINISLEISVSNVICNLNAVNDLEQKLNTLATHIDVKGTCKMGIIYRTKSTR